MITAAQMRAARALLGIDQRELAILSGISQPTIQRMEASDGVVRGVVDTLMRVVAAFDQAGIELISDNMASGGGGRGVRFKEPGAGVRSKDSETIAGETGRPMIAPKQRRAQGAVRARQVEGSS
jgi:transcriptional regulator with XRE-family HTH domain